MTPQKEWFSDWFNSPYYHILYKNRDDKEAELFLRNVVQKLEFKPEHKIVDLACGKGRHAIFLNALGFDVTGVDLAPQSIEFARKFANNRLQFEVQDLRHLQFVRKFDIALNLFTSFGYFTSIEEDRRVLSNIRSALAPKGLLLIDFFNIHTVVNQLVERESKTIGGIQFHISKWLEKGCICKKIEVYDKGESFEFIEKVQTLDLFQFEDLLRNEHFTLKHVYGNYALEPFQAGSSERLILVAQRYD